jgi:hypothetical protein
MLINNIKYNSNRKDEAFDHKIRIFYDVYNRISLPYKLLIKAFLALFKGITIDNTVAQYRE